MSINKNLPRGSLIIGVEGYALTDEDKQRLSQPEVGGVILFRRNFESIVQLKSLVLEIKSLRRPELLIAVDHEGGRVQRFIKGFTRLPAMRHLGYVWQNESEEKALQLAYEVGWVLAVELRSCGVDLSFTPVLDLDYGVSDVIGNRSFHHQPQVVGALASALQQGLAFGGMASCGKHFPGHGAVSVDSHHALPEDNRPLSQIMANDIQAFIPLIQSGMKSIMPAHVLYSQVCDYPAGFSRIWLQEILRGQLGFDGLIFSDDLDMQATHIAGSIHERVRQALEAGCDVALLCNRPDLVNELLGNYPIHDNPKLAMRLQNVMGRGAYFDEVMKTAEFKQASQRVALLYHTDDVQGVSVGEVNL